MLNKNFLLLGFLGCAIAFTACKNNNPTPNAAVATTTTASTATATTPATTTTPAATTTTPAVAEKITPITEAAQLHGRWAYGHEPFQVEFRADGTFYEYAEIMEGGTGGLNTEKPSSTGTWTFADGKVSSKVKNAKGKVTDGYKNIPVSQMGADYIFIGDFETEYASSGEEAGKPEEHFKEFGYARVK